jgi:arylsulfatase A
LPTSYGFDTFRGLSSGDGDFHSHIDRSGNEDWWHNNQIEMAEGYTTDLLTRYSIEFIAAHQKQPFFLYVPHLAIHFPWQGPHDPPHRTKGKDYEADKWGVIPDPGNVAPHVKAMVESLDKSVGAIVAELQMRNLTDRTLVIFTSDNGGYLTYGPHFKNISSNGVLRGQKTDLYEGGHRVPMAIAWPGKITPGVTAQTAHSVDLLPTIARLTGFSPDEITTDGIDLAPLLLAGKSLPDRTLFWRAGEQSAVRRGPWKLYRNKNITELYHLDDDLCERYDQAKEHPELVTDLRAAWNAWEGDVNKSAEQYNQ